MAPLVLTRLVLPQMIERGGGLIANVTSGVAWMEPKAAAGEGGWGLGYAISKGALHRVAGVLHAEVFDAGVACVNVEPGYVATERIAQDMARFGYDASAGAPPDAIGAAVAWLATADRAGAWSGKVFPAQDVCAREGLLPGFVPVPSPG
jgi:NAD(P)-dependent dehydrogenase (short-subunit alcohol dehydrogenase family)